MFKGLDSDGWFVLHGRAPFLATEVISQQSMRGAERYNLIHSGLRKDLTDAQDEIVLFIVNRYARRG